MAATELEIPSEKLAVVGLGIVSPLGNDEHAFWKRLINREHGIQVVDFPQYPHSKVKVGGVVEGFEEEDWERLLVDGNIIDPSDFDFYHVSTFAALEVARQSFDPFTVFREMDGRLVPRLNPEIFDPDRIGLVVATENGGSVDEAIGTHERIKTGKKAVVESIIRGLPDTPAGAIPRAYGTHGASNIIGSACASGEAAIAQARQMLLDPQSDHDGVLVVATDFSNHYVLRSQFETTTALSTISDPNRTPRPFDRDGDGFVIGNAAAAIFLVCPAFARRNRLKIRAWHLASAAFDEAYSMTSPLPNGEGTYRVYEKLWNKTVGGRRIGDMRRDSLYWVKAHGTGTGNPGDGNEATGIRRVTEQHRYSFAGFGSLKGALGHSLCASSLVENVGAIKSLEEQCIPPNIKCDHPMPQVGDMPLILEATPAQIEFVDTLSNGFGGHQRAGTFQSTKSTI